MPLVPNRPARAQGGLLRSVFAYDLGAAPYDLLTANALWREHAARLAPPAPARAIRRVLDVGCGPGASAFALAEALPAATVLGVDRSPRMLVRARAHLRDEGALGGRVGFALGDALRLPLADGAVDLVTGHSLLYLLPDRAGAVRELARVLAPGGALAMLEPSARGSLRAAGQAALGHLGALLPRPLDAARLAASMLAWRVYSGAVGRLEPDGLAALLVACGLREVSVTPALGGLGVLARAVR